MPVPPPPPPPPPAPPPPAPGGPPAPPPLVFSQGRSGAPNPKQDSGGRSALLADIHKGARLKKVAEVRDRSAPVIDGSKNNTGGSNAGVGNGKSAMAPPSGGLFAGGFPVLKPSGQRDVPGNKNAPPPSGFKASIPKLQDQLPNNAKQLDLPKASPPSAPATIAARPPPPRPTILNHPPSVPPSIPPPSSKPQLVISSSSAPPPPLPPPFKERSSKPAIASGAPPPPPPFCSQDKSSRSQRPPSQSFAPPPLPLHPPPAFPKGYTDRRSPSPSSDFRDAPPPPPPPPPLPSNNRMEPCSLPAPPDIRDLPLPPPPPTIHPLTMSARRRLSEPLPPPPNLTVDYNNVPTQPPKIPPGKPSVPPVPTHGRPYRAAGNNGGRLAPPPPPPIRSPSTELTSRQQSNHLSSGWGSTPQIYRPASLGNVCLDDFESKFTFHSVEDLPPPELFEPCERIYPSKCSHGPSMPPPQRPQIR